MADRFLSALLMPRNACRPLHLQILFEYIDWLSRVAICDSNLQHRQHLWSNMLAASQLSTLAKLTGFQPSAAKD